MRLLPILSAAAVLAAEDTAERNASRRAAQPQIYELTELARSAPPEFAAWGILRLLDARAVRDPSWQLDLAREALRLAGLARHPNPKRPAPGLQLVNTRAGMWQQAYKLGLDHLTLSMRAIDHLRRMDPDAAREAYAQYSRPAPAPAACREALIDDTAQWFHTGASLRVPSTDIRSDTEIAPAIGTVLANGSKPEDLETLAASLGQRLQRLPPSSRSFDAALPEAQPALSQLYKALEFRQIGVGALADGWTAWLRAGLSAPACKDSPPAVRRKALEEYNAAIEPDLPAEISDVTEGEADAGAFADTADRTQQEALFRKLLTGEGGRSLSASEKDRPEWREDLQKFIQAIEGRTRSSDENAEEYFYRLAQTWTAVLIVAPAGPQRDRALQQYLSLVLANAQHIDPIVWFAQVEAMTNYGRSLHGSDFARLLAALDQTGHPVLRLYARLESAYPAPPRPPDF